MSDKCTRSVPASEMAGYQDLSDFERGLIIGAREMGHSISEVAMKFGFSRATNSRVYCEYRVSCKTSNLISGILLKIKFSIGYPVKHQISAIGAAGKRPRKKWTIDVRRESSNEIDVQHFLILPRI
ncbi:hypothetical protein AVEN_38157-1 [Araneus ventricosus]|uniref:Tc3 transposase DNA binding domain-containing protein n=1 Tax=Araneus ventricosus TaxID=182803 RepID=A0A4Y2F2G4_ARAVE|nr:hypothetical protein AVEN_38157-1 [Araneus ventricosus]